MKCTLKYYNLIKNIHRRITMNINNKINGKYQFQISVQESWNLIVQPKIVVAIVLYLYIC